MREAADRSNDPISSPYPHTESDRMIISERLIFGDNNDFRARLPESLLMRKFRGMLTALVALAWATPAAAQQPAAGSSGPPAYDLRISRGAPLAQPPAGSAPVVYLIAPCWEAQGNQTVIEPATYLYYIQLKASQPSQGVWIALRRHATEKTMLEDFHRLWNTNFLDNLSIEVDDYKFANGVIGKMVTLQHGGTAARQDRTGLHRHQTNRYDQGRREAQGARTCRCGSTRSSTQARSRRSAPSCRT